MGNHPKGTRASLPFRSIIGNFRWAFPAQKPRNGLPWPSRPYRASLWYGLTVPPFGSNLRLAPRRPAP
eukprot:3426104-Pyramimonas_sp.AAC.1